MLILLICSIKCFLKTFLITLNTLLLLLLFYAGKPEILKTLSGLIKTSSSAVDTACTKCQDRVCLICIKIKTTTLRGWSTVCSASCRSYLATTMAKKPQLQAHLILKFHQRLRRAKHCLTQIFYLSNFKLPRL